MCFSDKESHSEHYVKVGLGNKTSRGPGSPVESTLRISSGGGALCRALCCALCRAHLSSSPVLLSSHSLAPCLQQVTSSLCQQAHTCVCVQYQPSEDIQGRTRAKAPGLPSPTIQPSVRQQQSPPATILACGRSRLAGEAGSSTGGCHSHGGTNQAESWRGAPVNQKLPWRALRRRAWKR